VYVEKHHTTANLHGRALLMFQLHTSEIMFKMVSNFLIVLCCDWKICPLGLSLNKTRNMTRRVVGVVTQLQDSMHDACSFFCIWCGAHQLDLVKEHIMNKVVKKCFFLGMIGFITHLIRQHKLITDMGTTCLRIVNH
jgi:hypothetical protein